MATAAQARPRRPQARFAAAIPLLLAATVFAVLVQSLFIPIDSDVSWLITVNEKMLAGQRLYTDVIEPNPPASIWLYTPAVWAAAQLRLRAEAAVVALFILFALCSCAATLRLCDRLSRPPHPLVLAASVAFVTLVLPLGTFAQREHAALLLALPVLAGLAVIADRQGLSMRAALAIGAAAGMVIVIKPHFALAMVPPLCFAAWRARGLKPVLPVALAAAGVVAGYAMALVAFAPDYFRLLPMLGAVYLPLREQWTTLLRGPVLIMPLAIYALAFILRPRRVDSLAAMFLIGSAGFALAALIQAKGYLNHALPAMALGLVGLALVATQPEIQAQRRRLVLISAAALAGLQLFAMASIQPIPGLAAAVARVAPAKPSMITLGPDLLTGHPLVRNVDGRWVGSRPALFIAAGAHRQLAGASGVERTRLQRWYDSDIESFAADVRQQRPDVILVDVRPEVAWLRNDLRVRQVMAAYRPAARAGAVEVWVRR